MPKTSTTKVRGSPRASHASRLGPLGEVGWSGDRRVTSYSERAQEILGWPPEEVIGKRVGELPWYADDSALDAGKTVQEVDETGTRSVVATRHHRRPDGSIIHCEWYSSVTFRKGKVVRVLSLVLDVTARVAAEKALQKGEERLRASFAAMAEGLVIQAADGEITACNPAAERILGLTRKQMAGRTSVDSRWRSVHEDGSPFPGSDHPAMVTLRTGRPERNVVMGVHKPDGTLTWISINSEPLRASPDAPPHAVVTTFSDITAQVEQARQLREARDQFSRVLEGSNDGFWEWDIQTGQIAFSDRWAEMLGYDRSELEPILADWHRMVHPGDREEARATQRRIARGEMDRYEADCRLQHKDGHWVWVRVRGKVLERDGDGRPARVVGSCTDISERKVAEEAQRADEAKYRRLFDSLTDAFVLVDMEGVIRDSNDAYRRMTGYSADELQRMAYTDLTPERWHAMEARIVAEQILPRGSSDIYEKEYRRKDGTIFPVELRTFLLKDEGRPLAMWAIVRDLTETRNFQAKLAMASRLAALGTLVSGVAHEINNPLAAEMADQGIALEVVRQVMEHLRGDSPLDRVADGHALEGVVEALEDARESAERIARIVKDLSMFGKPDAKRQRTRIMDVLDGALRWLPSTVSGSVSVEVENLGAPDVVASPGQIEQILVNLITNAAKATPGGRRGTVIVRTGPGLPGMARVEVIDQGTGIDPAIGDRIFDPFFTTRPAGPQRGTGLGLAICQSITTAHAGTLTFESTVGNGTTFRLELPAAAAES